MKNILMKSVLITTVALGLMGCGDKEVSKDDLLSETDYKKIVDDKETAFVFVTDEEGKELEKDLEDINLIFKDTGEAAKVYNVYMKDGKTLQNENINILRDEMRDKNDLSDKEENAFELNTLTFVDDGQVTDVLDMTKISKEDAKKFIKKYK